MKKAVAFETVDKPYEQLTPQEIDPITGCTVCEQDQQEITIGKLPPIKLCKRLAAALEQQLNVLHSNGTEIISAVGYRVGLTRGDIDKDGNRTGFSNHSYGVAIDINSEQNGLYDRCITYGPACRLIKGGAWNPDTSRFSITENSRLVHTLHEIGLLWGGSIKGKQKDFMHFSPTGY